MSFFGGGMRDRASELMDDRRKNSTAVNYFNVARMRSGAVFAYPRGAHSAASCWSFFNPAAKKKSKQMHAPPTTTRDSIPPMNSLSVLSISMDMLGSLSLP